MATQISTAFVTQFSSNVMHLAQQQGSRLAGTTLEEPITGEKAHWDQVGKIALIEKTGHNTDTPISEPPHSRRMCVVRDYENAILIDKQDRRKMLLEPQGEYTKMFAYAIGRLRDKVIIDAATADALTGKTGTTTTSFDTTNQRVAVDYGSVGNSNLTVKKIKRANSILNAREALEQDRYACINADMLEALQDDDEFTSRDYTTLAPLMDGQVPVVSWMGFRWLRSEQLNITTGTIRRALFWQKNALKVGLSMDPTFRMDERPDKSYALQVYAAVSWGATRMEEETIVEVLCDEAA